jgi:hypothetical protein
MPSAAKILLALAMFTMATNALPTPQLAGEGQALDSIFTDTDNGVGHGIENAEENTAALISGTKGSTGSAGSTGGSPPPPPPPPPPHRRQLDKISNGFQAVSNAAGTGSSTTGLTNALDNVDGTLTSGAANAGASIGGTEDSTLEGLGKAVPRL